MIGTSSLAAALPPAAVEPTMRTTGRLPQASADPPLDPAVTLDLSPAAKAGPAPRQNAAETADQAHYRRDLDSKQIVFQILGPDGSVVDQLPSEASLRARTYAREAEAARSAEIGTAVARSA